ncbi:MAG: VWA domain-containing protein [Myxococcales bacterium]|nr:VWA domain-containing protein [Myxococcales bacterium]
MVRLVRPALALLFVPLLACSSDGGRGDDTTSGIATLDGGSSSDDVGDSGDSMAGTTGSKLDTMLDDGDVDTGMECAAVSEMAQNELAPVDIIFAIDTSGSMSEEKNFVQQNMNIFSQKIFLANIDHHVVMISEESPDGPCINVPLGSGSCPNDSKLPEYLHVVQTVSSSDALQQIINTYPQWMSSMRPNSVKHVVVVSDDDSAMDAATFDATFKALDPGFTNYYFHAIVAYENPDPLECFAMSSTCCAGLIPLSADVGQVYLDLVNLTGGISGDLCEQQFGPVFNQIAQSVQATTPLACEWDIPEPPEGESFDPTKVNVELTIDGMLKQVYYVEGVDQCNGGDGWYYYPDSLNPQTIRICPATCAQVQGATDASVDILFGCDTVPIG